VGVAPKEGEYGMIPPGYFGGNMDNRLVARGAHLFLPVNRDGALVSFADPHASQGDGEVSGSAIETSANATVRLEVHRGHGLETLVVMSAEEEVGERVATMGVSSDLYVAAREATKKMIDYLSKHGYRPEEAYVLCGVAGNLRISEIVDEPNYVVSLVLPKQFLDRT
jgi:acetamidase/formamidase